MSKKVVWETSAKVIDEILWQVWHTASITGWIQIQDVMQWCNYYNHWVHEKWENQKSSGQAYFLELENNFDNIDQEVFPNKMDKNDFRGAVK